MWWLRAPGNCPYLLDILAAFVDTFVITKQTHFLPVHLISVSEHFGENGPWQVWTWVLRELIDTMERKKELQTGHAWEAHRVKQASIPVGEILERGM